jgi:ECF transporter S component (folate family)
MLCGKESFFMQNRNKSTLFKSVKVITAAAMLCAMSVVIGFFCKSFLNFGLGLFRVTFENLPIIIAGIMFGPWVGGAVGAASDLVSFIMSGQVYPWNPAVTFAAAVVGVVAGIMSRYVVRKQGYLRLIVSSVAAHAIGSMIIKPIALYEIYGLPVLWRIPLYLFLIVPLELTVMCLMYRNAAIKKLIDGDRGGIL